MIIPLPPPVNISSGLLLNGFICTIVALSALTFTIFLFRRWSNLTPLMRAYAFFWMITIFPWVGIAARYFMFVGGVNNYDLYLLNERLLQLFLFAFLSLLLFKSGRAFLLMLAVSLAGFFTAAWIMWQPDGFAPRPFTDFTVDPTLNFYGLLAGTAFVLLLFHSVSNIYKRLFDPAAKRSYHAY